MTTADTGIEDIYELTPMQQGMLFHSLVDPSATLYVEQMTCEVRGDVPLDRWQMGWQRVLERHPILRTAFVWEGLDKPLQVVSRDVELPWQVEDLRGLSERAQTERVDAFLAADRAKGFRLDATPLVRCALFRLADERVRFVWTYHHILIDGWCFSIVLREALEAIDGADALPPAPRPYRDYITWLQAQDAHAAETFWRTSLHGFREPTPLPLADGHATATSQEPHEVTRRLPQELTERLVAFAKEQRLTLNNLVQGAWALVLARAADSDDVAFGVVISGRPPELEGSDAVVGLFINTVPLRVRVEDGMSTRAFLAAVQRQQHDADAHGYSSLADIQSWAGTPHDRPLFETVMVFENFPIDRGCSAQAISSSAALLKLRGLELGAIETRGRTNYPVALVAVPSDTLQLSLLLDRGLYSEQTGEHLLKLLENTLAAFLEKSALADIGLTGTTAHQALLELGRNPRDYPVDTLVHEAIADHALRTPNAVAIVDQSGKEYTYAALDRRAEQAAQALRALGVKGGDLVAVAIERSVDQVVALYAVLKVGAAYLPLDPAYPRDRLDFIVADATPRALVISCDDPLTGKAELPRLDLKAMGDDSVASEISDGHPRGSADDIAYVIYTSGSTGKPKGVLVAHRNLLNLISWHTEAFAVTEHDRITHGASVAFDASAWEIWPTLASGAALHIVPPDLAADPPALMRFLVERQITVSFLATPVAEAALALDWPSDTSLRFMLTGGDRLHAFPPASAPFQLVNNYGPTETTVVATSGVIAPAANGTLPSIGRPIANAQIYILDHAQRPVPRGVIGEIYIGGKGVALGYLNRPELTDERFVPDPFSGEPDARMYKSGDLGSFNPDGTIAFHGRRDRQVQVRGVRVEPGEIEAALASYAHVTGAAVVSEDQKQNGDVRLIAFVSCDAPVDVAALASFLKTKLPPACLPARIVAVDALPMTPNGKVDYLELSARAKVAGSETEYIAPRTPHEEVLAGIWSAILGRDRIGTHDDFFEIGGHSLKAAQVVARAREAFGVELPLGLVFEHRTIAAFARAVAGQAQSVEVIPRVDLAGEVQAAPGQESLWFIDALGGDTSVYNVPMVLRLRGKLDTLALTKTIELLVERHEALRTVFDEHSGKPIQKITPRPAQVLSIEPIEPGELEQRLAAEVATPFSLAHGPIFRARLFEISNDEHVLVLNQHHIIIDAWSLTVLLRELCIAYASFASGTEPMLPPLPIRFADWTAWQHDRLERGALDTGLDYWKRTLANAPESIALPFDRPRPEQLTFRGALRSLVLPAPIGRQLETLAQREGASLFMTVLAAFAAYLSRLSGQDDLVIGSPAANRDRAETEHIVGYFLNTLALRIDLSDDPTFSELLARVRKTALDAYAHQEVPFQRVVAELGADRRLAHNPLFQVMFTLLGQSGGVIDLPSLEVELSSVDMQTSKFDLTLSAEPRQDALALSLEYSTDLFDDDTIGRMLGHLERVLTTVARDASVRVSEFADMDLTDANERRALLELGRNPRDYTVDTLVHEAIAEHARRSPGAIAIVDQSGQAHTYEALDHRAEQAAHALRALGVKGGDVVAVAIERSIDHLVALYAVLKAGAAYLPLDPAYPRDRLDFIVRDAKPRALVIAGDDPIAQAELARLDLKALAESSTASEISNPQSRTTPDDLAYVIYTSGSTGNPKGVLVTHRSLLNMIAWHTEFFGLTERYRTTHVATVAFDAAVGEIWPTLASGAALHIIPATLAADPPALMRFLVERQITVSFLPTPVAEAALALEWPSDTSLRFMLTGGDRLHTFPPASVPFQFVNNYGPTEATMVATAGVIAPAARETSGALPSIGRPIGNAQIYILDHARRPVRRGVVGEIYIGGKGVALGYLNRPELTDERFVRDPFSGESDARMYKSGDLGSFNPDGTIAFHGRRDRQVQVRGVRVEPGEIEAALALYTHVTGAAVVSEDQKQNGDVRLIAFVSCDAPVDVAALASFLKTKLPPACLPARIVAVDALPMTPNGKVDYLELAARAKLIGSETEYIAPRTPHEEVLAGIWSAILGRDRIGMNDDFFEVGGHSLKAAQVVARAREAFGVELPLSLVFEHRTIAAFARAVAKEARSIDVISRVDLAGEVPLAPGQESLWFIDALGGDTTAYNVPMVLHLRGKLDTLAMTKTIELLVERHEALRTVFEEHAGKPIQKITPRPAQVLSIEPIERAELEQRLAAEVATPFSLAHGPIFRACLFEISDDEHVLLLNQHHIIIDAWSLSVLLRELCTAYASFVSGTEPMLPALPIRFADWTAWQHDRFERGALDAGLAYWKRTLANAPESIALPFDRPRPEQATFRGALRSLVLPAPIGRQLETLAQREGASLFMTLLAAFAAYLSRISGQEDMVIGSPAANRDRAETEHIVGYFLNTLALRVDLSGDPTFSELLARVRKTALDAYAHQEVPFGRVVAELGTARRLANNPLFQVMFTIQGQSAGVVQLPSLEVELSSVDVQTSKFDLTLFADPAEDALNLALEYSTDLFDDDTIERMLGHLERVLTAVARDGSVRISELALFSPNEQRAIEAFNATARSFADRTVVDMFAEQAAKTPDAIALEHGGETKTYRELEQDVRSLASRLVALGTGPDALVAICLERSIPAWTAVLAVLHAGGAYVPLDPSYPEERLRFMLADSRAQVLLTSTKHPDLASSDKVKRIDLDRFDHDNGGRDDARDLPRVSPEHLAYVLYTSGSTGKPKGVAMPHRPLANLIEWQRDEVEIGRTLQFAPMSFDVSFQEAFSTWCMGGTLVLVDEDVRRDPDSLVQLLDRARVERLFLPAVALHHVAQAAVHRGLDLPSLSAVITAGDQLRITEPIRSFFERAPRRLHNHYGPTESHVVTAYTLEGEPAQWPGLPSIGRPVANSAVYVLDKHRRPVPIGVSGELYLAGTCLARGYLWRPELTDERFIELTLEVHGGQSPDSDVPHAGRTLDSDPSVSVRAYKTGDVGRLRPDGTLEFFGRADDQVKVRGFRVEPGEIERALCAHTKVRDAAVIADGEGAREKRLIAYVVSDGAEPAELRAFLAADLPDYMVPSLFVPIDALPRTPSGKVDRRGLPAPIAPKAAPRAAEGERSPAEDRVARIFGDVLGRDDIGLEDSFFDLGGHSLLAMQIVARLRVDFSVDLRVGELFEHSTVSALTRVLEAKQTLAVARPKIERAPDGAPIPLSFQQERLWFLDQLHPGSAAYNLPMALRLTGKLDVGVLESCLRQIIRRHRVLAQRFVESDGQVTMTPTEAVVGAFDTVDVSDASPDTLKRLIDEEAVRVFDLATGPLIRARLFKISNEEHIVVTTMHHAVSDGWSTGVLVKELSALYVGQELPELEIDYLDYAFQQRLELAGEAFEKRLDAWRQRLSGVPEALNLPADRPRPATPSLRGSYQKIALGHEVSAQLDAFARRQGSTPFMVLLGAFTAYLSRITGADDIVVGTPTANRERRELEPLIGFFINTLPMRVDLSGDPTFEQLVARARSVALDAYALQDVPLERIVEAVQPERNQSHAPLFQVTLVLQNTPPSHLDLAGLTAEVLDLDIGSAKSDLALVLEQTPSGFSGALEYSTDLFDADRIERMIVHLSTLIADALEHPEKRVSELAVLAEEERALIGSFERGPRSAALDAGPPLLHELVERYAKTTPDAVALECNDRTLSYAELNARANKVAHRLLALGAKRGDLVALSAPRSFELIVGLVGALKAGTAYVPLDPAYPKARLDDILQDSGAKFMLVTRATEPASTTLTTLRLDETFDAESSADPGLEIRPDDAAYVIYTSGSTGRPKGVVLEHRGLANVPVLQTHLLGVDASCVALQFASINFDASVWEIVLALGHGGRLVLVPSEMLLAGDELRDVLIDHGITDAALPPTSLAALPQDRTYPALRRLISAGERCPKSLVKRWARDGIRFFNGYGPTEATIAATIGQCDPNDTADPSIGSPVLNGETLVLDAHGNRVPIGVPGELHLGGAGLARGYLHRDDLTRQKFIAHPLRDGARLYKSGDLARFRQGGRLEYLGRIDNQVKLRGFRIELGEIEAQIALLPEVQQAHVVVHARGSTSALVAYVVPKANPSRFAPEDDSGVSESQGHPPRSGGSASPRGSFDAQQIREHMKSRLPDYMVPAEVVFLDALPVTPNGKIDSRRLPAPDLGEDTALLVAPRTREEQMLAAIWAPLLGRESIGAHDHFFALGGHSLLAAQVISRVRKVFGVDIPLAAIFEHPTLEELAAEIVTRRGGPVLPPIVRTNPEGDQPLSFAQERLRFLAELEGDNAAYNIPAAFRLVGLISPEALERSLAKVIERHDSLSTIFPIVDGEQVARVVRSPFTLIVEDVKPEDCARRVAEEAARPFVLTTGPVLRARLFRVADEDHVLSIVMHHIVSDGWSMGVMLRELFTLYAADVENRNLELPALPIQYADYAAWQRTWLDAQVLDRQLTHWKQALAGAPFALELPMDRPRPPFQTHRGGVEKVELPRQVARTLHAWSTENGATVYMTLLAAFAAYLARISGQDDLILGSPFAGRRLAETEGLIGFFVNTLPIRVDLSGDPNFIELVDRVRRQTLAAHENQDVPFEKLVEELHPERVLGASPIFQVMFALQQQQPAFPELSTFRIEPVDAPTDTAKFDLTLSLGETDSGIEGGFEFDRDLFDAPRVARMARHFATFVERALEDPQRRISDVDFLDADERARLMPKPSAGAVTLPSVVDTFADIVKTTPQAIAVESELGSLTYAALDERAGRIASELASHGIGRDDFVAMTIPRSLEAIAAMLGILKAGAVYLPIDAAYPEDRIAFMLEDSGARAVLNADGLAIRSGRSGGQSQEPDPKRDSKWGQSQEPDPKWDSKWGQSQEPDPKNGLVRLAYCIYTSGSTGQPKGVLIEHASLAQQIEWEREALGIRADDRVLQISSLSFDVSCAEIFVALTSGARLVLPPPDIGGDTDRLARFMRDFKVTVALPVPSLVAMLVDEPAFKEVATLRLIGPAGEALPSAVVKKLNEVSAAEVWNLYGPTETTIYATAHRCLPEMVGRSGPTEPIGQAIAGLQAIVLDPRLRPVPDGVPGELYLEGATLARGYKDRAELTASRFIEHTFDNGVRLRMYKTGDIVRRNADGALVFMGRADRQVKLRGFRIELGEVEAAILRQEGLREAAAIVIGTGSGARLTAFVTTRGREHDSASLKKALERELPAYMVPGEIVWMESLPHSGSGKLDYRALESTGIATAKTHAKALPRYDLELTIVRVFEQVLDRPGGVGVDESFFDLGGHSLLAHRLKLALEQSLGRAIPLLTIFQNPTPERLANVMRTGAASSEPSPLVPLNVSAQARLSAATPDSRPALFVVPGGASTPFYFLPLARELGDLDVFGLQPRGLDGEAPVHDSVEAYAAWYADAILTVQPAGPYYLAGHSFGGLVAFEISQDLRARGHEIALVGLFDTLAPSAAPTRPAGAEWDTAQWLVRIAQTMQSFFNAKVDLELDELRAVDEEERFALAVARMQAAGLLPAGAQPSHVKGIFNVTRAQAGARYQPQRTAPVPLVVFCATDRSDDASRDLVAPIDDASLGWSALLSDTVIAHLVPGTHGTLVREPHVTELAAILKQHLGRLSSSAITV